MTAVHLSGYGHFVPERVVDNAEIVQTLDIDEAWIDERAGVLQRRHAHASEATSDLALHAARLAVHRAHLQPNDLDLVIVATLTPDHTQPATAAIVQSKLQAQRAMALDMNAACSGFLYALEFGRAWLAGAPGRRHALVIGADVYSRILDPTCRRTYPLFGDGAGAVVLSVDAKKTDQVGPAIGVGKPGTDHWVMVPYGGSRANGAAPQPGAEFFKMQGRDVKDFVLSAFPQLLQWAAASIGTSSQDLDFIVCHQGNYRMLEDARTQLGIPQEKMLYSVREFGNTGSASIPLTLSVALSEGTLRPGDTVGLIAFGGGMSCGASGLTI
ncbi:beta-ketoacyl-ACP synthase 3 [Deinococcus sp. HMF7620]|uniref:Beta-ketoacyl-ACP synthase 3 n=1 Tax=Deinococcus arboris TaxID=2682977 RepID=A0A7C9HUQ0_9DEIO|nr:ketoacyl-ACP synthase III [Deinococcus arboris]MVN89227.1 beta-ketoacyl-ACP synthase 3 [Deinococcus arboris]